MAHISVFPRANYAGAAGEEPDPRIHACAETLSPMKLLVVRGGFSYMRRSMPTPSLDQLKRAIAIKEQIATLEAELANVLGGTATAAPASARLKRKYTKRAEAAADAAPVKAAGKPKRTMSAEGRARIIAAQKARWAKIKKGK